MKQRKIKVDDFVLEDLLQRKGLLGEHCYRQVLDHDMVEQFFINGMITDSDLRSINAGSTLVPTLRIEEADVQGLNESDSERSGSGAIHDRSRGEDTEEVSRDSAGVGETEGNPTADV